jgi:3'(2'), 5'-bisphosphate nucleotidase
MTIDVKALLEPVKRIAAQAGERILKIYDTAFEVNKKADDSPLTTADLASHEIIVAGLQALTPDIPILSEESAALPFSERSQWNLFWLVDPLDGTKEFVKRNGEFTVNIALIQNHEPILGVVQIPVTGLCYFATRDQGAFRQAPDRPAQRIAISTLGEEAAVRVVGSRTHAGEKLQAFVARLGEHTFVPKGSSLKFCLVAEGKADIYPRLGPTSEWDTAAAQCVVEAAGGQVLTVSGERLSYNTKDSLLNPYFLVIGDASRQWLAYLSD